MNLEALHQRFLHEDAKTRLGHLASDLLKAATFIEIGSDQQAKSVIFEGKYLAEWSAGDLDSSNQSAVAEIQSYLALRELQWLKWHENPDDLKSTANSLRNWSQDLLRRGGFINDNE